MSLSSFYLDIKYQLGVTKTTFGQGMSDGCLWFMLLQAQGWEASHQSALHPSWMAKCQSSCLSFKVFLVHMCPGKCETLKEKRDARDKDSNLYSEPGPALAVF